MPKNPVFDQARGKATPELVESLFASSQAYWDGPEYWTLNPLRGDSAVGSFSINGHTGLWSDFASGDKGDLLKLMVDTGKAPSLVRAAEMVVAAIGGTVPTSDGAPTKSHLDKPKKIPAVIPVPKDALPKLEARVKGTWAQENRGTAVKSWAWRRADGEVWTCTTRYEKTVDGEVKKDVIAHYWGEDGRWHEGNPMTQGRHLYRLDQVAKAPDGTKFLIVEGEKKVMKTVSGHLLTTWIGGAAAWTKTDWAPLEEAARRGDVLIWPDADEPGLKAGMGIAKRLPGAALMDIRGKPSGWDLADAIDEGIDPVAFIEACPVIGAPPPVTQEARPDDTAPFLCLGYDKGGYFFMRKDIRVVFSIGMGGFTTSKAQALADLSWWLMMSMVGDKGGVKIAEAQDYIQRVQHQVGFFDPKRIRGAGVWRDAEGIILNDGRRIVSMDGRSSTYDKYASAFYYVPSGVAFGEMHGPTSTDEDGVQLERLFHVQEFEESSMAVLLLGWCLIAPFAGVLKWRPHIWLTGRSGTGKSWLTEELIKPLMGPFAFVGSGKDTEAGIRWALDQDARPALFAEMEPKSKPAQAKITSILELARNASSDDAGNINISQAGGGTKSFKVRSMFAFVSTMVPTEDAATTGRITRVELRATTDRAKKFRLSTEIKADLMDDPGRFTRRIFHALPRIIADIEWLRSEYMGAFRSQRAADQVAPMLAAAWAVRSSASIREAGVWLDRWVAELSQESKAVVDDEDTFMTTLLASHVRTDKNATRTVAELLGYVERWDDDREKAELAGDLLERYGISLRRAAVSASWRLYIATNSPKVALLFKDTPYEAGYGAQVRRHKLASGGNGVEVRMAGGRPRCQAFEWDAFKALYLSEEDEPVAERPTLVSEEDEDDIPF